MIFENKNENWKHNYVLCCNTIISRKGYKHGYPMNQDRYLCFSRFRRYAVMLCAEDRLYQHNGYQGLTMAISANIRHSLTVVWKKDMKGKYKIGNWVVLEEVASCCEKLNSTGVDIVKCAHLTSLEFLLFQFSYYAQRPPQEPLRDQE